MTREVFLGGQKAAGRVALVDDEDYDLVMNYRWHIDEYYRPGRRQLKGPYVKASICCGNRWTTVNMHTVIFDALGIDHPRGIDHIDHDGLNNQRLNLRAVTSQQNGANARPWPGCTSSYKGVYWHRQRSKWVAAISKDGHSNYLGIYESEIEAARTYNKKAVEFFGEYAYLNEIEVDENE